MLNDLLLHVISIATGLLLQTQTPEPQYCTSTVREVQGFEILPQ